MNHLSRNRQAGYGMVQIMVVCMAAIPLCLAGIAGDLFGGDSTRSAPTDSQDRLELVADEITRRIKPARLSTIAIRDQLAGEIELSDWYTPTDVDGQVEHFRFEAPEPGSSDDYGLYTLRFVRDEGEKMNGADDDGDGFIDEGRIESRSGVSAAFETLATGIRVCTFQVRNWEIVLVLESEQVLSNGSFDYARVERLIVLSN